MVLFLLCEEYYAVASGSGNITYIYDATGVKQKKIVSTGTNTLYVGNFIYEGTSGNESLQFFDHPEGYVEPDGSNYNYVYQYKDHLGNIRLSYQDANNNGSIDASSEIIEEKNYYPFGLTHRGYNGNVSSLGNSIAKKYMFGGKEYQDELDLDWYDVSARNYDPAIARWMNLDPLAEKMRRHSPYNFGFDNPVYFQDYDGMAPEGCCGGIGEGIARAFRETPRRVREYFKEKLSSAKISINNFKRKLSSFVEKLSGGKGSDGYNFTSKDGGGEETRQGDRDTQSINADPILQAATIAGKATAPLNKSKVPDLETISTVVAGIEKGSVAAEVVMDELSGSLSSSNNNEPNSDNELVSVQLHTKHPSFGYRSSDGQLMDRSSTTFRDTTVTVSTAKSVVRRNDSIQRKKLREARENFINRK